MCQWTCARTNWKQETISAGISQTLMTWRQPTANHHDKEQQNFIRTHGLIQTSCFGSDSHTPPGEVAVQAESQLRAFGKCRHTKFPYPVTKISSSILAHAMEQRSVSIHPFNAHQSQFPSSARIGVQSSHGHRNAWNERSDFLDLFIIFFPSTSLRPSPQCTSPRRWCLLTNPSPTQIMSPRTTSSRRLMSSPSQNPWPSNGSPSNGPSKTSMTRMPQSVRCFWTHTENKSVTPNEMACRLVCRRPCPTERGNPLEIDWRDQIRTLLDRQSEQILADCEAYTNSMLIMTEEVKKKWNDRIAARKLHRAQAGELHRRDQQLLHAQL